MSPFHGGRVDGVVPLTVEIGGLKVHERELLVRYPSPLGVDAIIDPASHREPGRRRRGGDQIHDDLVGDERLAAPVLGDE